jgi:hypothetical protein
MWKTRGQPCYFNLCQITYVVSCIPFQFLCPFVGSCFGHAMSKVVQYASNDVKVCFGFIEVSLNGA